MAPLISVRKRPRPRLRRPDTEPLSAWTARLDRNRSGYWEIRYSTRDPFTGAYRTVPLSTRTRDPQQAQDALARFKASERLDAAQDMAAPTPCLQPILDQYLDELERKHRLKRKAQEEALTWPRRLLGDQAPAMLDRDAIAAYCDQRRAARGVRDSTLRRELGALRAALRWAAEMGKLPAGDVRPFKLPDTGQSRNIWLNRETEARVHGAALAAYLGPATGHQASERNDVALFLLLALNTAARRGAILTLSWDRIDLQHGVIDYRDPDRPPTRKRRVPLPINDRLRPVLELARNRACGAQPDGVARGRVFQKTNISGTWHALQGFAARHGVPQLTPHVCRHTWATLAAQAGASMHEIASMLGDTIQTVTDNYLHHTPDFLRSVANRHTAAAPYG